MKNLKVSTQVLLMAVLAIFFTILVASSGYMYMNLFNNNIIDMHKNGILPLSQASTISTEFIKIRLNVVKAKYEYDSQFATKIIESDKLVRENLKSFISGKFDSDDKITIDRFSSDYDRYLKTWDTWNLVLKGGGKISIEDYNNQVTLGSAVDATITSFKNKQIKDAGVLEVNSQNSFKNSRVVFISIFIVVLIVFISISFIIIRIINKSSKKMVDSLVQVSKGDFTFRIENSSNNEFGKMEKALSETIINISNMIHVVKERSSDIDHRSDSIYSVLGNISSSTDQVTNAIQEVAKGTGSQAEDLVDTATVLHQFGSELDTIVDSINDIDIKSKDISSMANDSNEKMLNLVSSMENVKKLFNSFELKIGGFSQSINQIHQMTNVITNIAAQTNLLALNAAIEAARAGEAGKGFTVVADEIRKLAELSRSSLNDINSLINNISGETGDMVNNSGVIGEEINSQVEIINVSIESFRNIIQGVESVIPKINMVNKSAESIDKQKDKIMEKVQNASAIAEEVSASSQEIAASSEEMNANSQEVTLSVQDLSNMTKLMMKEVNKFQLR
ncbi:MAG: MCP four helix bundle domain-containing protein [Clostridiaceae bacterium]|nr:MCP four helix bundle domain-containing protein [Clostridiaceae bacterium]